MALPFCRWHAGGASSCMGIGMSPSMTVSPWLPAGASQGDRGMVAGMMRPMGQYMANRPPIRAMHGHPLRRLRRHPRGDETRLHSVTGPDGVAYGRETTPEQRRYDASCPGRTSSSFQHGLAWRTTREPFQSPDIWQHSSQRGSYASSRIVSKPPPTSTSTRMSLPRSQRYE